jgi:hypothetical protein
MDAAAQVKDFEAFRRSLPAEAKMFVAKNTLMRLASQRVDGWADLATDLKLEHAWVFAPEEAIGASVKAFLDFEAKLLEPFPKAERAKMNLTDIAGTSARESGAFIYLHLGGDSSVQCSLAVSTSSVRMPETHAGNSAAGAISQTLLTWWWSCCDG